MNFTIKLEYLSRTGAHTKFVIYEEGIPRATFEYEFDQLDQPPRYEDMRGVIRTLVKLAKRDRTKAQLRTLLEQGVTINL